MANKINNSQLVTFVNAQLGSAYIWGGLGKTITEGLITQMSNLYPSVYTAAYKDKVRKNMGKKSYDCVGLIKCAMWGNTGDGVLRIYDASTDVTANAMMDWCPVQGDIATFPHTPGSILWMSGHVGVYVGNNKVVEARGVDYGVVQTELSARGWKKWGQCNWVDYDVAPSVQVETYPIEDFSFNIHRARLRSTDAFGKVLDWAAMQYKVDASLEGAINASFAYTDPVKGILPVGTVIMEGAAVTSAGNGWGFGIDKAGNVHIDRIWGDPAVNWLNMLSGTPPLIFNKVKLPFDETDAVFKAKNPRSVVARRGSDILFITVDGRQTGKPGMTIKELQDYLLGIDCDAAINLDGGGSSIQIRDEEGTGAFKVINSPTEYRAVYNVIAAYRKPKAEPPKPTSLTMNELVARLRSEGINTITL